jgi:hypothetical protein
MNRSFAIVLLGLAAFPAWTDEPPAADFRYVRSGGQLECTFVVRHSAEGSRIESTTNRGKGVAMVLLARYDRTHQLQTALARLGADPGSPSVRVDVAGGMAIVRRKDIDPVQEFEVPPGVIVTSAPDWTDLFQLCRRHDRTRTGKQEFAALWIHPTQPAQKLTFSIEKVGTDAIEHDEKKVELARLAVRIRNNSPYVAWADAAGKMIKLMAIPFKAGSSFEMTLQGYEKSAAKLKPVDE